MFVLPILCALALFSLSCSISPSAYLWFSVEFIYTSLLNEIRKLFTNAMFQQLNFGIIVFVVFFSLIAAI